MLYPHPEKSSSRSFLFGSYPKPAGQPGADAEYFPKTWRSSLHRNFTKGPTCLTSLTTVLLWGRRLICLKLNKFVF